MCSSLTTFLADASSNVHSDALLQMLKRGGETTGAFPNVQIWTMHPTVIQIERSLLHERVNKKLLFQTGQWKNESGWPRLFQVINYSPTERDNRWVNWLTRASYFWTNPAQVSYTWTSECSPWHLFYSKHTKNSLESKCLYLKQTTTKNHAPVSCGVITCKTKHK